MTASKPSHRPEMAGEETERPMPRPGWTAFEKVTEGGMLRVPPTVLHALGVSAGRWLAFSLGADGQIEVMSKAQYRERFGGGLYEDPDPALEGQDLGAKA